MKSNYALQGKTVVLTGAAGGIGQQLVQAFAAQAQALVQEIQSLGMQAWAFEADVSVSVDVARMAAQVQQACGGVDVPVNSAMVSLDALSSRI